MATPDRKSFLVRMPLDEHEALTRYAAESGLSMNDAVRALIRQQMNADHVVRVPMTAPEYARLREIAAHRGMSPEAAFLDMFRAVAALPAGYRYVPLPIAETDAGAPHHPQNGDTK